MTLWLLDKINTRGGLEITMNIRKVENIKTYAIEI